MGRKTSVYLADDILAALAKDPRPLAEVIRAGLGIGEPTVGRSRTLAQVDDLRAHGGEVILAEPGQPDPEPDLGPRTINLGRELRVVDLHAQQRAAAAAAAEAARNAPPRQLVQPDWHHYVSDEAHQALQRHGYPADYAPRGVTGDPGFSFRSTMCDPDGKLVDIMLRNRVCQLDGIEVDGHAPSDLDPGGGCLYCGADLGADDDRHGCDASFVTAVSFPRPWRP
jgi:hypothetical protein